MTLSLIVALADGFEEIEAVTPIDVLRRAGLRVTTVGISGKIVTGSHSIAITADQTWDEVANSTPDVLLLPGGMPGSKNLGEHAGLKQMAERITASDGWLAAICAAPAFTLGAWGLLSKRNATCYPGCETQFSADTCYLKDVVVTDGKIITACGPGAAFDFSLKLVNLLVSPESAENLRSQMLYAR